ncbi:MAG TPA: APC family permease [Candidatus Krumholzibacteria bacterium]|nr:APC family permease [Candidatus Krumholzibacteria bacterium]
METPRTPDPPPDDDARTEAPISLGTRLRSILIGPPRDLRDRSVYEHISLIAFLAWVGLGADGLSSSSYGPEEAFKALGGHTYLAVGLALMTAITVFVISSAYNRIIELFPHGGGGYFVATKLLGRKVGAVSGSALVVDYVLTITISIAAAGDALFSLAPIEYQPWKLPVEILLIVVLLLLNLRGVRESVLTLTPIFLLFLFTHLILIVGATFMHASEAAETAREVQTGFSNGLAALGAGGLALLFIHAYSLGGGTYTGIEAVSNGLAIMREPRAQTGKRTMLYMSISLAFTAAGLILCYLLWDIHHVEGKTMNAVLAGAFAGDSVFGKGFVIVTLVSEGALLVVAAQAGFVGGPRVLANMAVDSWMPHRFAALSDRLVTGNGVILMCIASLAALVYTRGDVSHIVVMYSINVFVTFSLSMLGMLLYTLRTKKRSRRTMRRILLFSFGLLLCGTILVITTLEKFSQGGWVTLLVTGGVVWLCFGIRRHYENVSRQVSKLYESLIEVPRAPDAPDEPLEPKRTESVAGILVGDYGGVGLHTCLSVFSKFPGHFNGVVFVSVGVVDSKEFKGAGTVEALRDHIETDLKRYVAFARKQGIPATYRYSIDTEAVEGAERLCLDVAKEFPHVMFFAGKVIFGKEQWYHPLLHNETAYAIQRRLQWAGQMVVVVPIRVM